MKYIKTAVLLLTVFCLCVNALCVTAERYDWSDGTLPESWKQIQDADDITATGILEPVNPNASQEARNLYAYLCTVMESDSFLTGLFDMNANNAMYEQVQQEFGVEPALYSTHYAVKSLGFSDVNDLNDPYYKKENGGIYMEPGSSEAVIPEDLMTFTDVDKINALAKQHYDNGNIVLLHSDEGARKLCAAVVIAKGKYTDAADVIMELDATNPDRDMQAYALWCRFQQNQADALRRLEDSGVKAYLLRYWIEFNYENFHGLSGDGYGAFVRVFQQTTQNLIDAGLTGFLVTYSPGTGGNTLTRDPGNDYVDCYGVTLYSPDTDLGHIDAVGFENYTWYVKTGKPISFTEFSCRTGIWADVAGQARASSFDLLLDAATAYPRLTFVNFWGDGAYSIINNEADMLDGNDDGRLFLDSPFTLELSEIIDYRHTSIPAPGVAQVSLTTDAEGMYYGLEERLYPLKELQAMGIDPTRVNAIRANSDYAVIFYEGDNGTGKEHRYVGGNKGIAQTVADTFRSCRVVAMENVALELSEIYASDNDGDAWKANDGFASFWSGVTDDQGTAWMYIDLGTPHIVNHYVVKNVGVGGLSEVYNLRDFAFQYSTDGESWQTVATVSDNTLSTVNAGIDPVIGQYFRILITDANSYAGDNTTERKTASISEFELYGIPYPVETDGEDEPLPEDSSGDAEGSEEPLPSTDDRPESHVSQPENEQDGQPLDDTSEDDRSQDIPSDGEQPGEDTPADEGELSTGESEEDTEDSDDTSGVTKRPVQMVTTEMYIPWWVWCLVAAGVVAAGVVIVLVVKRKHRDKSATDRTVEQ